MRAQLNIGRASTVLPLALVSQSIHRLSRHDLESLTERLIEELDSRDGDPDEETGNDVEDDFLLSDTALDRVRQDHRVDFVDQDANSWTEWQSRGRHKLALGQFETRNSYEHEDEEEDDPSGQHDEDGINTLFRYSRRRSGAGCSISDPGGCDHEGREEEYG